MNFKVFLLLIFFACLLHTPDAFAGDGNTKNTSELSVDQYQKPKKRKYTKVGGSRKYRGPSITNRNKHYARRRSGRIGGGSDAKSLLSGGVTSGLNYGGFSGIKGTYEYKLNPMFSAGIQGNIYFMESSLSLNGAYGLSLRGNYHFSELINVSNFDLYGGINLGTNLAEYGRILDLFKEGEESRVKLAWGFHVGARYQIASKWVVFGEISKESSGIGLGFSF